MKPNEDEIKCILGKHGYTVLRLRLIPEGSNHYIYSLLIDDGNGNQQPAVVKFRKVRIEGTENRDTLFGGPLSMKREADLYRLVRDIADLPAPKIYASQEEGESAFILAEKLPGELWCDYISRTGHRMSCFTKSMRHLGRLLASCQCTTFSSFGDIIDEKNVHPGTFMNFADRFLSIYEFRMNRALKREVFSISEFGKIDSWIRFQFADLKPFLSREEAVPVLVLTDLHGMNFLVDGNGVPTGFFDLESCQAAHPAMEIYGLAFFMFNYYKGRKAFSAARKAFFRGMKEGGSDYDPKSEVNIKLEQLLSTCRVLELAESYFQVKDGLRDSWSERFRSIIFEIIEGEEVNYEEIGAIQREKTQQPSEPVWDIPS